MPNKIDDFTPYRFFKALKLELETINPVIGYNSTPFITEDPDRYLESTADDAVLIMRGSIDPVEKFAGGSTARRHTLANIEILGKTNYKTEDAVRKSWALEQDVRTAVNLTIDKIRSYLGKGAAVSMGASSPWEEILEAQKRAGFQFSISLTWSQSSDW
jgi:hypothetical protein